MSTETESKPGPTIASFDPLLFSIFIPGKPAPGGSKRAIPTKKGKIAVVDDAKGNRDWKSRVADQARIAWGDKPLLDQPIVVRATFFVLRPKGHFGVKGLKPSAPEFPTTKPDLTKLFRATEDALTGVVWRDDPLIVEQHIRKAYGEKPGVYLLISDPWRPK